MSDKEIRRIVRAAYERGWEVAVTKGQHIRLTHPSGAVVGTTGTRGGGHGRGTRNLQAAINRVERAARC